MTTTMMHKKMSAAAVSDVVYNANISLDNFLV